MALILLLLNQLVVEKSDNFFASYFQFLDERYHLKFISRVAEVYGKVTFHGDFEVDFKEFLLQKGF